MAHQLNKKTLSFRKRFNLLAAPTKFETARLLGNHVANRTMPTMRPMTDEEHAILSELSEWCNDNIFFNRKPNGSYDDYGS